MIKFRDKTGATIYAKEIYGVVIPSVVSGPNNGPVVVWPGGMSQVTEEQAKDLLKDMGESMIVH